MITNLEPLLAAHPFTMGLEERYLQLITGCAGNARFEAGQQIFRMGEDANSFYIIRSGKVSVGVYAPGRGHVMIETLTEGDVLGWSWLFPPYQWHFDAQALDLTRAIVMDGKCLRSKCEADPQLGYEIMKRVTAIMMQRLESAALQLLDIYGKQGK